MDAPVAPELTASLQREETGARARWVRILRTVRLRSGSPVNGSDPFTPAVPPGDQLGRQSPQSHSSRTTPTDRVGTVNADDFALLAEVHETRLLPRVVALVAEWARL